MNLEIAQIITQIISFLLMLWILKRYAWGPIMRTIDERKHKIEAEFQNIEEEKKKAREKTEAYQNRLDALNREAQERMKAALDEAKIQAQKIQEDAHQQARGIIIKAQEDIQKEIKQAQIELKKEIVQTIYKATETVLKQSSGKETDKELLDAISKYVEAN